MIGDHTERRLTGPLTARSNLVVELMYASQTIIGNLPQSEANGRGKGSAPGARFESE